MGRGEREITKENINPENCSAKCHKKSSLQATNKLHVGVLFYRYKNICKSTQEKKNSD